MYENLELKNQDTSNFYCPKMNREDEPPKGLKKDEIWTLIICVIISLLSGFTIVIA